MHPTFTFRQGLALHVKRDTVCGAPGNNQLSTHGHDTTWRNRADANTASRTAILDHKVGQTASSGQVATAMYPVFYPLHLYLEWDRRRRIREKSLK